MTPQTERPAASPSQTEKKEVWRDFIFFRIKVLLTLDDDWNVLRKDFIDVEAEEPKVQWTSCNWTRSAFKVPASIGFILFQRHIKRNSKNGGLNGDVQSRESTRSSPVCPTSENLSANQVASCRCAVDGFKPVWLVVATRASANVHSGLGCCDGD